MNSNKSTDRYIPGKPARLYSLDLLRFMAALSVVIYHFSYRGALGEFTWFSLPALGDWTKYSFMGVDLFFIISGFVIAWSADKHSFERFVGARFLRLYPAFIIGVTLTFIVTLVLGNGVFSTSIVQYLANLTFLPQIFGQEFMDGVYWSIVVELIFYFWVAVLVATGAFRRALPEILALWLIVAMLNEFYFLSNILRLPLMTPFAGLFVGGIMLYRWKIAGITDGWDKLLFVVAVVYSMMIEGRRGITWDTGFAADINQPYLVAITAGLFVVFALFLNWKLSPRIGKKLAILGALSYPLYLIHQHIGYMIFNQFEGYSEPWILFIGTTGSLLLISAIIAHYIEPAGRRFLAPIIAAVFNAIRRLPYLNRVLQLAD